MSVEDQPRRRRAARRYAECLDCAWDDVGAQPVVAAEKHSGDSRHRVLLAQVVRIIEPPKENPAP